MEGNLTLENLVDDLEGLQLVDLTSQEAREPRKVIGKAAEALQLMNARIGRVENVISTWRADQHPYMTLEVRQLLEDIESALCCEQVARDG